MHSLDSAGDDIEVSNVVVVEVGFANGNNGARAGAGVIVVVDVVVGERVAKE